MTPFEIALSIRNRPDPDKETVEVFALREHAKERMADFGAALELCIGWERAYEDFAALLDCLKPLERRGQTLTIAALIERSRQLGYNAKLEALLARRWRCPHCKQFTSIDRIEVPIGEPERLLRCTTCNEEGVYPAEVKARLEARDGGKGGLRPL